MMRKNLLVIFFVLFGSVALGQNQELRNVFSTTINLFPKATLLDVYKGTFQGYFGPAHIISDSAACARYIEYEMSQLDAQDSMPLFEEVGEQGYYYRVNLRVVREGLVSVEQLVSCLMRSSEVIYFDEDLINGVPGPISLEEWKNRWLKLVENAPESIRQQPSFDEDEETLSRLLDKGYYVFHHSSQFNEAYHYHYRLIRRDIFLKEIYPQTIKDPSSIDR